MGQPETKRVLKADTTHSLQYEVAYNFEDLERRCEQYLEQVREKTRGVIVEAQAEADFIRKTAQSEGYDAGYQAGLQKAEQEIQNQINTEVRKQIAQKLQPSLPLIQNVAESMATQKMEWFSEWESKGVTLAIAIAERILHLKLSAHPEGVVSLMQEVLEMVTGESQVSIHIHPDDASLLEEQDIDLNSLFRSSGGVRVQADESITRGGCFVRTEHGEIDARLETQLGRLAEELLPGHDA